jgi:hypothetical protein
MDQILKEKIQSCAGNDGCAPDLNDGKAVVNKVRQVGVGKGLLDVAHEVNCECGTVFNMVHYEEQCPGCGMVFGVTPCSSHDSNNIKPAGIKY